MSRKRNLIPYLRDEVVIHNDPKDIWVIVNENVFNLTPLVKERSDSMNDVIRLLLAFAGKDLSSYFDKQGQPLFTISSQTGNSIPTFPPAFVTTNSEMFKTPGCYWYNDPMYLIGFITKCERPIRLINTLYQKTHHLTVCEEDTIFNIMEKYKRKFNWHAGGYEWRKCVSHEPFRTKRLNLNRTLSQNGIFAQCPAPALWLYYQDDHTIA